MYDRSTCAQESNGGTETRENPGFTRRHWIMLDLTRHKKVDPETEFESESRGGQAWASHSAEPQEVPGLGERALLIQDEAADSWKLRVLDGGVVFSLSVQVFQDYTGEPKDGAEPPELPEMDSGAVLAVQPGREIHRPDRFREGA